MNLIDTRGKACVNKRVSNEPAITIQINQHMTSPPNTNDKSEFGLSRNIKVSLVPCLSEHSDLIPFLLSILLYILLCSLENLDTFVTLKTPLLIYKYSF